MQKPEPSEDVPHVVATGGTVSSSELRTLLDEMLEALQRVHPNNAELRQLWLETLWLKSDFENSVLMVPTRWQLTIIGISRGRVTSCLKRYPQIVEAADRLGRAIRTYLNIRD